MPTLDKLVAQMRQQHHELGIAIAVFDRMSNGHSQRKAEGIVEQALTMASGNGHKPKRGRPKKTDKRSTGTGIGNHARPLPEVEPIKGLDLSGMESLTDAIPAAVRAVNEPVDARTLTAYIRHAGFKTDARGVSSRASLMARDRVAGIKRNKKTGLISISE